MSLEKLFPTLFIRWFILFSLVSFTNNEVVKGDDISKAVFSKCGYVQNIPLMIIYLIEQNKFLIRLSFFIKELLTFVC